MSPRPTRAKRRPVTTGRSVRRNGSGTPKKGMPKAGRKSAAPKKASAAKPTKTPIKPTKAAPKRASRRATPAIKKTATQRVAKAKTTPARSEPRTKPSEAARPTRRPVVAPTPEAPISRSHDARTMRRELAEVRKRFRRAEPIPFDVDDGSGHWFELRLPSTPEGEAVLVEVFAPGSGGSDAPVHRGLEIPKGRLSLALWLVIDDRIRAEFNGRLDRRNERPGAWGSGVNRMSVPLGWELSLLFWGAEGAPSSLARRIFSVWSSLVPEERWWLYNQAAALGGAERDHDHAWRRALRLIFQESGALGATETTHLPLPRPAGLTEKRRSTGS